MPEKTVVVSLKVSADTPVRVRDKEALLKAISDLPAADQQRVLQICTSKKALAALADNWAMLQAMFK